VADPAPPAGWTTCLTCGDATAPGALRCPTCGAPTDGPEAARAGPRRLKVHRWLRISLVLAVAAGLSGVLLLAFVQGPPVAADPLTGSRTFSVAAGGYQFFSGAVTGGDYVTGNFTVLSPPGAQLVFAVYNSTEFALYQGGRPAIPAATPLNATSGIIDFSAIVTDNYFFVFENTYPPASHLTVRVYSTSQYMSNVVVE
jgi:hypothetical protein